MLKIKDDQSDDVKVVREKSERTKASSSGTKASSSKKVKSSGKAKMKIGSKNKKKGKKKKNFASEEAEHQEYCEVRLKIILNYYEFFNNLMRVLCHNCIWW